MYFPRYLVASAVALAIDVSLFYAMLGSLSAPKAAFFSYLLGAVLHFVLSKYFVFRQSRFSLLEVITFLMSCGAGTGLTVMIVALAAPALGPLIAKSLAVAVSFFVVYVIRKRLVFRMP